MRKLKIVTLILITAVLLSLTGCSSKLIPARAPAQENTNTVGFLTLYAFDAREEQIFLVPNMGHSFVAIKNTTAAPVQIRDYTLMPDKEVTMGTYGHQAHFGIWYNLEACYLTDGRYKGIGSVTRALSTGDFELINEYVGEGYKQGKDYWSFDYNCSAFALAIWNYVSADGCCNEDVINIKGTTTPAKLYKELTLFEGFELNRKSSDTNLAYYHNGTELVEALFRG